MLTMLAYILIGTALDQIYTRYLHPKIIKKLSYKKRGKVLRKRAAAKRATKAPASEGEKPTPSVTKTKAENSMNTVHEHLNKPNGMMADKDSF